jgi:hypothetical protein
LFGEKKTSLFGQSTSNASTDDKKPMTSLFGGPVPKPSGSLFGGPPIIGGLFGAPTTGSLFSGAGPSLFPTKEEKKEDEEGSSDEEEPQGEKSPPTYADPDKIEFKQTFGQTI